MIKTFKFNLFLIGFIFIFCNQSANAQVHVLKIETQKNIDKFIPSSKFKSKIYSKPLRDQLIYITDNNSYTTFVPNFRVDSLRYAFPNFPIFTHLKDFDLVVIKTKNDKQLLTHDEFSNQYRFTGTNTFKNYFGTKAEKYISKNSFYDLSFLIVEGESNIDTHPFLKLLKDLKLLDLQNNQKVIAIDYLGLELDMKNLIYKRAYSKNINTEIYSEDDDYEDTQQEPSNYKELYNIQEIKQSLNKDYAFDTEQIIVYSSLSKDKSIDTLHVYSNKKTQNSLSIFKNYFSLFLEKNFIRGQLNDDGTLQPENYFQYIDTSKIGIVDLKDYNIISKKPSSNTLELIVQSNKEFWHFFKYEINLNPKDETEVSTFLLPENTTIKGQIETLISFTADYSMSRNERSSKQGKRKYLEPKKTFFVNE